MKIVSEDLRNEYYRLWSDVAEKTGFRGVIKFDDGVEDRCGTVFSLATLGKELMGSLGTSNQFCKVSARIINKACKA